VAYSVSSIARSRRPPASAIHLLLGQRLGHARRLLGRDQRQAGIAFGAVLAQGPGVEAAQRGQPAVGGGGAGFLVAEGEPGFDISLAGIAQGLGGSSRQRVGLCRIAMAVGHFARIGFGVFQPAGKARQVAPVGSQSVGRQAVFQPDGVDEGVDIGLGFKRGAGRGHARILRLSVRPRPRRRTSASSRRA
jgi:hypothetical protein